jgi:hypothetical protein
MEQEIKNLSSMIKSNNERDRDNYTSNLLNRILDGQTIIAEALISLMKDREEEKNKPQ